MDCCEKYIESVLFQYDLFPMTNAKIYFDSYRNGKIKKVKYFLDSSGGDSVHVDYNLITKRGYSQSIIKFAEGGILGGNRTIKGTFNSTVLEFETNMLIKNDDKIELNMINGSANDVTIMAVVDIEYMEGD